MSLFLVLWPTFVLITCPVTLALVTGWAQDNESLFLTPLLDKGEYKLAQSLSEVSSQLFTYLPRSHAGYLTVDRNKGNHLFFWHFPSNTDPKAPLLMWLNGGPTVSSMLGLFWEHGPLEAKRKIFAATFEPRNSSWTQVFSVVYVDNPVGTGYSFSEKASDGYRLTQDGYTHDLYHFVQQFFIMFPEYKSRGFYIGGQSYAGKYIPALANKIHLHKHNETSGIPLMGIILGGPYFDPPTESVAFFDYLYALGVISHADMERNKLKVKGMYETFLQGGYTNAKFSVLFQDLVLSDEFPLSSLDNYVTGQDADYALIQIAMTSSEMRKAVHVGRKRPFFAINHRLSELYGPDVLVSTKSKLAVLMDEYKVLIYNGDYDTVVSSVMVDSALLSTQWSRQAEFNNSRRLVWRTGKRIKGFYSQTGQFCRVVVHGAGHQTPHDVPDSCLEMVTHFLQHGCIRPGN